MWQDIDQRVSRDVERLCSDLSALIPTMVKPVVDILWFSAQLWRLTGRRGMTILYVYMLVGFTTLQCVPTAAACHVCFQISHVFVAMLHCLKRPSQPRRDVVMCINCLSPQMHHVCRSKATAHLAMPYGW